MLDDEKNVVLEDELKFDKKDIGSDELKFDDKMMDCKHCICDLLSKLVEEQTEHQRKFNRTCSLQNVRKKPFHSIIPFLLQTPYGHPFFTWGKVGSEDCFATVFFKVIKVDCKENCAVLQLLEPNVSIIDHEVNCVEPAMICDVDFVIPTNEKVLVDLRCYSAIKLISPDFVKKPG
ncbi:CotY/CotZ family spore coat protein [Virgibacillus byunsanensis]|uniref:CotY/CotZ family spore coat protein n=1 Tax=Virgibacillus byunsanensis TaxID=570945 RepID=A0ABW3LLX6_9BACI